MIFNRLLISIFGYYLPLLELDPLPRRFLSRSRPRVDFFSFSLSATGDAVRSRALTRNFVSLFFAIFSFTKSIIAVEKLTFCYKYEINDP